MRNYLKAEFYKLSRRKYLWVTLGVVLFLESLLLGFVVFGTGPIDFYDGATNLLTLLVLGLFAPLLTCDMVFADQYKNGTLRNELSFGLSRTKIYWGKLLAQTALSLALCGVFLGYYLGGCWLLLGHDPEADAAALTAVGCALACVLPLWLGMQGLCCAMCFAFRSDLMGAIAAVGLVYGLSLVLFIAGGMAGRTVFGDFLRTVQTYLPDHLLTEASGLSAPDWALCARTWRVGAAWFALSTAVGLAAFRRKEL